MNKSLDEKVYDEFSEDIKLSFEDIHLETSLKEDVMTRIFLECEKSKPKSKEAAIPIGLLVSIISISAAFIFYMLKINFRFSTIFDILNIYRVLRFIVLNGNINFFGVQLCSIIILTIMTIFYIKKGSVINEN